MLAGKKDGAIFHSGSPPNGGSLGFLRPRSKAEKQVRFYSGAVRKVLGLRTEIFGREGSDDVGAGGGGGGGVWGGGGPENGVILVRGRYRKNSGCMRVDRSGELRFLPVSQIDVVKAPNPFARGPFLFLPMEKATFASQLAINHEPIIRRTAKNDTVYSTRIARWPREENRGPLLRIQIQRRVAIARGNFSCFRSGRQVMAQSFDADNGKLGLARLREFATEWCWNGTVSTWAHGWRFASNNGL